VPLLLTVVKGQATPSLSLSPDTTSYGQESAVDMTVGVPLPDQRRPGRST
jgi:hypothetical protein